MQPSGAGRTRAGRRRNRGASVESTTRHRTRPEASVDAARREEGAELGADMAARRTAVHADGGDASHPWRSDLNDMPSTAAARTRRR
jgi:hypothetical protein